MQFEIVAEPSAALLCRLIGLLAQQDLDAPNMAVRVASGTMRLCMDLADPAGQSGRILAEKMARCIGVEAVTLNGVPLALQRA